MTAMKEFRLLTYIQDLRGFPISKTFWRIYDVKMDRLWFIWCVSLFTIPCWSKNNQPQWVDDVIDTPAVLAGDVVIGGLFHVFETKEHVRCGADLDMYSVMEMEAVKWSLMRLNEVDFIPGVRLGLKAYPTCGVPSIAALQSNKFLQLLRDKTANTSSEPVYVKAVIGPVFSSESEVVSRMLSAVPDDYKLLQVSYSSTAALLTDKANAHLYPNFFRTIPSDRIQMETIEQLLVQLEWTYIGLIHSGDAYGIDAAHELSVALSERRICIATVYQYDRVYSTSRNHFHEFLYNVTVLNIKGIVFLGDVAMVRLFIDSIESGSFSQYSIPSIIFSESIGLQSEIFINSDSNQIYPATKGAFVLSPPHKEISEFSDYWNSMFSNLSKFEEDHQFNPWLQKFVNSGYHKILNVGNLLTKYPSSTFVKYAIMATFSVAKIIKDVHERICYGSSGLCPRMKEEGLSTYIEQAKKTVIDFDKDFPLKAKPRNLTEHISFSEEGDIQFGKFVLMYEVYNYQALSNSTDFGFVKVGSLRKPETPAAHQKPTLTLLKSKVKFYNEMGMVTDAVKSVCKPNTTCTKCVPNHDLEKILYIPGDVIVVVTFPIHNRGTDPFHCGPVRRSIGLDVALGAKFVINKLNKDGEIFPNQTIGLLLVDTCGDPLITSDIILELQLHGKINEDISEKILGYAGGFSSAPTLQVADITTELKTVQVSCCATSDLLSDRLNYPYFLGLATPLNYTTRVMLQIINKLGSHGIQIVFTDGKYGESAVKLILNLAPSFNICVSQTVRVYDNDNSINSIMSNLRKYPNSRHVLVYIASPLMPKVAKAINNMIVPHEFLFIGENCFNHRDYMLKYPNLRGSLVVAEQPIPQSDEYKAFLRDLDPTCEELPKSLVYFMQENLNCYYEFSFRKEFPVKCHRELLKKFPEHLEPWTPYLIKSTTALVKGAYEAIRSMCKQGTICKEYRDSPERVVEFLKNVTLDINGDDREDQLFDSNGNGALGLKIYRIAENDFVEVGRWRHDNPEPFFDTKAVKIYPSTFSCGDVSTPVSNRAKLTRESDVIGLIKTILVSVFAFIIVILLLAFICIWRRHTYMMSSMASDTCTKSEYNSIDDFSIVNIKRGNSETSLRLGDLFLIETPCGTPRSTRSLSDFRESSGQQSVTSGDKSSPFISQSRPRNLPALPKQMLSQQRNILQPRQRSEPALKLEIQPKTARRLNSEPKTSPALFRTRADSLGMPYIEVAKSRRLHSEPTLPSSNFSRLLFNSGARKESIQDHGYISPIDEPEGEESPGNDVSERNEEGIETVSQEQVMFIVGNPQVGEKRQGYSC